MEAYYYQRMDKPCKAAYHAMKTGFTALSPAFSVPRLDNRTLSDIFFQLRLDCPDIFYVTGFSYRFAQGAENVELLPEYLFDKGKIKDNQKALAARVAKLVRPAQAMSVWEKGVDGAVCPGKHTARVGEDLSNLSGQSAQNSAAAHSVALYRHLPLGHGGRSTQRPAPGSIFFHDLFRTAILHAGNLLPPSEKYPAAYGSVRNLSFPAAV